MGSSGWSDSAYRSAVSSRVSAGIAGRTTARTAAIASGSAPCKVHETLDPKGVTIRESRDSAAHPTSLPVAVWFDVTGSMGDIPITLQNKLGGLMAMLLAKGYVEHPQIFFGAVGDATCDLVPLQVGQFESGCEMDDVMSNIYVERGGGGQGTESYELAAWFSHTKFATDAWEKRGQKGYMFFIGDEMPYGKVSAAEVRELVGDTLQEGSMSSASVFDALKKKWNVYCLIPFGASNYGIREIRETWQGLLGKDHVVFLENPDGVTETIALIVGMGEGKIDLDGGKKDLVEGGTDANLADVVTTALVPVSKTLSCMAAGKSSCVAASVALPVDGPPRPKRL